jgi:hypothetical protein
MLPVVLMAAACDALNQDPSTAVTVDTAITSVDDLANAVNGAYYVATYGTALTAADGWADLPASGLINTTNDYKVTVALVAKGSQLPLAAGNTTVVAKT